MSTWAKGKLSIRFTVASSGERASREIDADIFGGLAVHEALGVATLDEKPVISISHVATGLTVSPCFFDHHKAAVNAVVALVALPVQWQAEQPVTPQDRHFLRCAVEAICGLCGGFDVESAMDGPGGHA